MARWNAREAPCNVARMGDAPRFHRALGWGLVAALLMRVALAARAPIIEVDGAYWAGFAAAIERGDFRHGLSTARCGLSMMRSWRSYCVGWSAPAYICRSSWR